MKKRVLSGIIGMALVLALGVTAMASESNDYSEDENVAIPVTAVVAGSYKVTLPAAIDSLTVYATNRIRLDVPFAVEMKGFRNHYLELSASVTELTGENSGKKLLFANSVSPSSTESGVQMHVVGERIIDPKTVFKTTFTDDNEDTITPTVYSMTGYDQYYTGSYQSGADSTTFSGKRSTAGDNKLSDTIMMPGYGDIEFDEETGKYARDALNVENIVPDRYTGNVTCTWSVKEIDSLLVD